MKKIIAVILAAVVVAVSLIACGKEEDKTAASTDAATEIVTAENGEAETEIVTDKSGKEVTETVAEKVTKSDGTVETVTKTVPVTEAVTKASSKSSTTAKKSSNGSSSKTSTTKKKAATAKSSSQSKATTAKATTKKSTAKATTKKATTAKATTKHTHKWVAQTKTETTYKWEQHAFCNGCGMDLTEESRKLGMNYALFQMKHCRGDGVPECPKTLGNYSTYHYEQVKVATGTEKVITGYKCSTCGATKGA